MTTNSPTLLRSVLMKHNYLSFLPTLCLEDDLKAGLICPLEVEGVDEPIDVMLTYRKRSVVSPVCHAFVEILREVTSKNERYAVRS